MMKNSVMLRIRISCRDYQWIVKITTLFTRVCTRKHDCKIHVADE
jgi:hypothetical protein